MARPMALPGLDSELKARLKARNQELGGDDAVLRSQSERSPAATHSQVSLTGSDSPLSGEEKKRVRRRDKILNNVRAGVVKSETLNRRSMALNYRPPKTPGEGRKQSTAGDLASSAATRLPELIALIGERGSYAQLEVAAAILENPTLLSKATPEGYTLVMAVVSIGDLEWALELLTQGAPADSKSKTGQTILHYLVEHHLADPAATELATQIIDHALAHGLKPTDLATDGTSVLLHALLHSANTEGHLVPVLLERGYDICQGNYNGITCLHVALANNYVDLAQYFVDNGASVTTKTSEGVTILDMAFQSLGEAHPLYYTIFMKVEEKRLKEAGNIIAEILQTETDYCRDLEVLMEYYVKALHADMHISEVTAKALFWNVADILPGNQEALIRLRETVALPPDEQRVAQALLPIIGHLRSAYVPYVGNQNTAIETIRLFESSCPGLSAWLLNRKMVPEVRNQSIDSYLIKPLQRITRYPLLVRELQKHIPHYHADYDDMQRLAAQLAEVLNESNEFKRVCDQKLFAKLWFRNLGVRLQHHSSLERSGACLCSRVGHKGKPVELTFYVFTECLVLIEGNGPTGESKMPESPECLWDVLYYEHFAVWGSDDPVAKPNRCLLVRRDRKDKNIAVEFDSAAACEAFQNLLSANVARLVSTVPPIDQLAPGDLLPPLDTEVFQQGFFDPADQEMQWFDTAVKHASIDDVPVLLDEAGVDALTALLHAFMVEEHCFQRDIQTTLSIGIAGLIKDKIIPEVESKYLGGDLPILLGAHLRMDDGLRDAWKSVYPPPLAVVSGSGSGSGISSNSSAADYEQQSSLAYTNSEAVATGFLRHLDSYLNTQTLVQYCSDLPLAGARLLHLKQVNPQVAAHLQRFQSSLDRTIIRRDHTDLSLQAFLSLPLARLHKQQAWVAALQAMATLPELQAAAKRTHTKIADLLAEIQRRSPFAERFASLVGLQETIIGAFRIPLAIRGRVLIRSGYVSASEPGHPELAKKPCRLYLFDDIFLLASPTGNSKDYKLRFWMNIADIRLIEETSQFRLENDAAAQVHGKPVRLLILVTDTSQASVADWSRDFRKIIKEHQKKKLQRVEKPKDDESKAKDAKKAHALASVGSTRKLGSGFGEISGRRDLRALVASSSPNSSPNSSAAELSPVLSTSSDDSFSSSSSSSASSSSSSSSSSSAPMRAVRRPPPLPDRTLPACSTAPSLSPPVPAPLPAPGSAPPAAGFGRAAPTLPPRSVAAAVSKLPPPLKKTPSGNHMIPSSQPRHIAPARGRAAPALPNRQPSPRALPSPDRQASPAPIPAPLPAPTSPAFPPRKPPRPT